MLVTGSIGAQSQALSFEAVGLGVSSAASINSTCSNRGGRVIRWRLVAPQCSTAPQTLYQLPTATRRKLLVLVQLTESHCRLPLQMQPSSFFFFFFFRDTSAQSFVSLRDTSARPWLSCFCTTVHVDAILLADDSLFINFFINFLQSYHHQGKAPSCAIRYYRRANKKLKVVLYPRLLMAVGTRCTYRPANLLAVCRPEQDNQST